jgi:type I restriction enzyme S subunit
MSDDLDFDMEVVKNENTSSNSADEVEEKEDAESQSSVSQVTDTPSADARSSGSEEPQKINSGESLAGSLRQTDESPISGWDVVRLGDAMGLEYGDNLPERDREDGSVPVYGSNGQVGTHSEPAVSEPGLVLGRKGSIGEIVLSESPFWPIDTTYYITREETSLNLRYLQNLLQGLQLESLNAASAIPGLNRNDVYNLRVIVPPLPEQRKIASVLYAVDQAIQKTEAIIEQAKRVKRGLMQKFFREGFGGYADYVESHHRNCLHRHPTAWEVLPAEKVMEVSRGSHPRPKSDSSLWGGDIPIIKIGDRDRGDQRRITATTDTVTEKGSDSSKRVPEGTLIVSNAGTCGVARIAGMGACIHDHWLILRDYEERLDTRYLFYYINYNQNFLATLASGSTVDDLNTDDFRLFDIAIPPLEEQQEIAATLDGLHDEILQSESKVDRLKRLKKGLMQDLLTGEVRTADKAIEVLDEVKAHG